MWPFRRHERAGRGGRADRTRDILSWAKRTLNDPVYGVPPVPGLLDSPMDVGDTDAQSGDWRSSVQDPSESVWGPAYTEVAKEPDGARAEPSTTVVVVTTQSPEASEGEAHIFADADEAKRFVERLIDDGFDRERIKTIRGGQTQLRVSLHAVVDFD
jgi:hypothetical protein